VNTPITTNRRKLEFDKKLKQIESDELKLKTLEQELLVLQVRVASEATPIVEEFCELRFENLIRLKQHRTDSYFKKKEKRQIIHLMVELAYGLQNMGDERAEAFLDELLPEQESEAEEKEDSSESYSYKPSSPTPVQTEGKLEIKSLFRQLAKAFHPDKEPLEHLKEEKTSLMKKITAAYENQDLYGLLKLEKEHMGPREFSEDKIELYIKHINDRLKELKSFEARLKKHGPLSTIYKYIYSRQVTIQEYNIKNELSKIEEEVRKEKVLQQIIWDSGSLRNYFKS
jgi:hypothetical protein